MSKYQQEIENIIARRGTITVSELSEILGVSDQTIRRIVKPMVECGQIEKVHGAIKSIDNPMTAPFQTRMQHRQKEKAVIAEKVADMIEDGQSLAIDTGSTAGFIAHALHARRNLTVVTNSTYVASTLSLRPGNKVFMAGTQLRDHDGAAFDRDAFRVIERMQVDTCILTAAQVHSERGFLVNEQCEADIANAMNSIANETIIAVDNSKFDGSSEVGMISISRILDRPIIVTDQRLSGLYTDLGDGATVIIA